MDDSVESLCGSVKVKSNKDGLWYKRYCVLHSHAFSIYIDETMVALDIAINTDEITSAREVASTRSHRFVLKTTGNEFLISTESHEALIRWITSINSSKEMAPSLSMNDFNIASVIGRGFYGKVMLVQHKTTGDIFALKSVHKKRLIETHKAHTIIAERNSLMKAKHPFIVRLCFAFQTPAKFYLGLEYASGGELFYHMDRRGALPVSEVRLLVAEIALAISYLHSLGIVYRDLKPENVMLDSDGHVKLTDFGLSKDIFQTKTNTICGTTEYLSPEVVLRNQYDYSVDWWALGVLMYEMLTEQTPFDNPNRSKMLTDIVHAQPVFPSYIPNDAVDFMKALMQKDPRNRPTIDQIKMHPFFSCYDWQKVYDREYNPEFVPPHTDPLKPDNFDKEFTDDKPIDSPVPAMQTDFPGFSYTALQIDSLEMDENSSPNVP